MILEQTVGVVERGGDSVDSKFSIKASATAFKILSDGLYSDKILAIIRELSCNAYDANVAAGKCSEPFYVHLPNHFEPYFSVRDNGVGLTVQQACGGYVEHTVTAGTLNPDGTKVQNDYVVNTYKGGIFNTYFESTKTDSNDFIGALGLGSKSPFSYVDSFTVTSRKDGFKYSFSAFINELGEPSITLLNKQPTDECNGLEVRMPVKEADFGTFSDRAAKALMWFNPQPNISGGEIEIPNFSLVCKGQNWKLQKFERYSLQNRALVVMGKIAYPINYSSLREHLNYNYERWLSKPIVFEVENGELDFAASRETLSYTPKTINKLVSLVENLVDEYPSTIQKEIDQCATLWDAKVLLGLQFESGVIFNYTGNEFKYKGAILAASNFVFTGANLNNGKITSCIAGRTSSKTLSVNYVDFNIKATPNTRIVVDDLKAGTIARCKQYSKQNTHLNLYVFTTVDAAQLDYVKTTLDGAEFILASSLPKVQRSPSTTPAKPRYAVFKFDDAYSNFYPLKTPIDITKGGYYVPVLRGNPVKKNSDTKINYLTMILQHARALGFISNEPVYGISRANIGKLTTNTNWVNVYELVENKLKEYLIQNTNEGSLVQRYNEWSGVETPQVILVNVLAPKIKYQLSLYKADHSLLAFINQVEKAREKEKPTCMVLAQLMSIHYAPNTTQVYDFRTEWKTLVAKYPLIGVFDYTRPVPVEAIVKYIQMVDSQTIDN